MADDTMTKREAGYNEHPADESTVCDKCSMFRPPNRCTLVQGQIHFMATCNYFDARDDRHR